ncbi:hypothetical protein T484DRAFT_1814888 [Baffinella frigidus]|nr:hypothetical protein T484DRAFT_1814888 [Cryptophyta sp. CCMP2293]
MGGTERFVVVGGGVCGVTCCQTLSASLVHPGGAPMDAKVTLIAARGLLKGAANVVRLSRNLHSFDIVEQVVEGEAFRVDAERKEVLLADGRAVPYDKLCICTGARPRKVQAHSRVLTLRDTESAKELRARLRTARRLVIAGNGGIAMELVHEISQCEVLLLHLIPT